MRMPSDDTTSSSPPRENIPQMREDALETEMARETGTAGTGTETETGQGRSGARAKERGPLVQTDVPRAFAAPVHPL
jgi:hypothetical protein